MGIPWRSFSTVEHQMYRDSALFSDLIDGGHSYSDVMGADFHVYSGRRFYWWRVVAPIMVSTSMPISQIDGTAEGVWPSGQQFVHWDNNGWSGANGSWDPYLCFLYAWLITANHRFIMINAILSFSIIFINCTAIFTN